METEKSQRGVRLAFKNNRSMTGIISLGGGSHRPKKANNFWGAKDVSVSAQTQAQGVTPIFAPKKYLADTPREACSFWVEARNEAINLGRERERKERVGGTLFLIA